MIIQVNLKNFKSYRSAALHLARLTVLIGANASGKSNVIEALRLLARIAEGKRLGSIGAPNQNGESIFRGGVVNLGYKGANSFGISCITTEPEWKKFEIELGVGDDGDLHVIEEKIISATSIVPLYEITSEPQAAGGDVFVNYNNFVRGGKKPSIVCSSHMAILTQLLADSRFRPENTKSRKIIPEIAEKYMHWLSSIVFLDPEPGAMRSSGRKTDKVLKEHGENLSGVIYNLCRNSAVKAAILEFIQCLHEQDIEDISFVEIAHNQVLLQLTETFRGSSATYDAATLSDGTLRVLSIAAAMLSAPEHSLVVIEALDQGVHPSRAADLLGRISSIAKERSLRVLLSSHNPALLDALPDEAVPATVLCYRSPEDGSSQLVRLRDIPDYPALIAQGSVGHLMTHGLLERGVKQYPGAKQKQQKAMKWLAALNFTGDAEE